MGDDDVGFGHAQRLRHVTAQRIDTLTVAPDAHLAADLVTFPLRNSAGRRQRSVGEVRFRIFGAELSRTGGGRIALFADDFGFRGECLQPARIVVGQGLARIPLRNARQPPLGANRLLFALRDDTQE